MNTTPSLPSTVLDVNSIIEPLAGYVCAAENPVAALKLAVSALYSQIEQNNSAANEQMAALLERRRTMLA